MIKFKVDEKEYIVPEMVTIDKYVKIYKMKDILTEEYFAAKLINIVCDCPLEDLLESDYQEVNYIASHIMGLIPLGEPKFVDRFEIDGVHYGFFPNWKDLSFAEFVDMDTISTKKEDELLDLLHILSSIMYRPITEQRSEHDFDIEKYEMKSMKLRSEVFKNKLNISIVLGAQFFFINYAKRYSDYSLLSLTKTLSTWMKIKLVWSLRRMIWTQIFKRHTDGSLSSTDLLTMILQNTTRSFKKT